MITSTLSMKSLLFATMKTVNYQPDVLGKMDAEEKEANSSISVDKEGYVAEGLNLNDVFITHGEGLVLPSFDKNHKNLSG